MPVSPDVLDNVTFLGNSTYEYLIAVFVFIVSLFAFKLVREIVLWRLKSLVEKTTTDIDDLLVKIIYSIKPPFYVFLSFFVATRFLILEGVLKSIIDGILVVWLIYQASYALQLFVDYGLKRFINPDDQDSASAIQLLSRIGRLAVWVLGGMLMLSNLGVNITSLIAGLGIGGVAVAFALQNILGDLFSSFAIYLDKPFRVGDFIVLGDKSGTVEKIGIKTTRVRSLGGEEIVFSNQELTSAQIQNYKKLERRRIAFDIGVVYQTSSQSLNKIPKILEGIISKVENVEFSRSHFKSFGDSALIFETVYFVNNQEYNVYMDAQQEINFKIKEALEKEKIEMAYPTQTLYIQK